MNSNAFLLSTEERHQYEQDGFLVVGRYLHWTKLKPLERLLRTHAIKLCQCVATAKLIS